MWSPTHIQVTIQRAKGLLTKGKNDTNNCFVTIALGKEKYQTSVKEKAEANVTWQEECELKIPDQGNRAELVLTCLHRNNLGIDEFLGQATLPLNEMDFHDRPRSKWYKLESKPGKEKKNKERGELEVRITFNVKSGSLTDLSKKEKHKSSIGQLASSVGGSLLSIGTIEKRKGIKKFAKSLGSKMHLNGKKKNKDADDGSSFSGSFNSIGTPNSSVSGNRRSYGQRAGEADPGVISEDEDEFVFDNLSHKSSASSLAGRAIAASHTVGTLNFTPRQSSPLLMANGKPLGKQLDSQNIDGDNTDIFQMEQTNTLVGAHTLPPPTKPPRTPQLGIEFEQPVKEKSPKLDEWESKLYGKHLDLSGSETLKRRSWELNPVPLPATSNDGNNSPPEQKKIVVDMESSIDALKVSSPSTSGEKEITKAYVKQADTNQGMSLPKEAPRIKFLTAEEDSNENDFDILNAKFAQFEQKNSSKIFNGDLDEKKWLSQAIINAEAQQKPTPPQAKPRNKDSTNAVYDNYKHNLSSDGDWSSVELKNQDDDEELKNQENENRKRAEEDARLEEELRLNEQKLREEEAALQDEIKQQQNEKLSKREMKRREEDERILNFARQRSLTTEGENIKSNAPNYASTTTPEQSPKQRIGDNREKRFGKFKYFNRKDKSEGAESPKSNERIIIGHEKSTSHAERRSEITAALTKKYEGKSREELMLIANGMENEALLQRQRVKELEDYLDNLLLRVMETQPKLLQNPYSRTTSAKSG